MLIKSHMGGVARSLALTLVLIVIATMSAFADVEITKSWNDDLTGNSANNRIAPTVELVGETSYEKLLNLFYPVGCYFISEDSSFDPNTAWGGTWEKIEDGRTLIAANSTYPLGSVGGEATHKLTMNELPEHWHYIQLYANGLGSGPTHTFGYANFNVGTGGTNIGFSWSSPNSTTIRANGGGGNQTHNNMPPYRAVNMWKRVS